MPTARKNQIDLTATPYYHVYSRCVRRAFLCGRDALSGSDFSHRRELIEERLALLARMFTIEVCAFALMENHFHLVLCINAKTDLQDAEVVRRWKRLFSIPDFVLRHLDGEAEHSEHASAWIEERRQRLSDLSWYMRCLKEYIARVANREDNCTGRFWESRFHCNALTNEKALLTAMAYVDLNPIRAGQAKTPETSDHTSVKQRTEETARVPLKPFADEVQVRRDEALPLPRDDYLELVDWTGRVLVRGKSSIPAHIPPILDRIGHDERSWLLAIKLLETRRYAVIGPIEDLRRWAERIGQKFLHGVRAYHAFGC